VDETIMKELNEIAAKRKKAEEKAKKVEQRNIQAHLQFQQSK
jgi:hypothetical protein